jgi:WD40 repeat protein
MRQVVEQEPVAPSQIAAASPATSKLRIAASLRDLDTICLKCLEKDPARRYASAGALADDLQRWLDHEPILARPASTAERVRKWIRRRPAWAALTVTVAVSLAALGVGAALFTMQVMKARTAAERANRELARSLFIREWQEAEALVARDKAAGALTWFARAVRLHPEDTALATRLLALLSEHAFALPNSPSITNDAPIRTVALSPDDAQMVTADTAGHVRCWSVATGQELFTLPRLFNQPGAAFVPSPQAILVVDRSSATLWPKDGGSAPLHELSNLDLRTFALCANGQRLALGRLDGSTEVRDTAALQLLSQAGLGDDNNPNFLQLSRDGQLLLRSRRSELRVYQSESGRLLWRAQPELGPAAWFYANADFTGDNRQVVGFHMSGVEHGRLTRWPLDLPAETISGPLLLKTPRLSAPVQAESSGIILSRDSSRALVWTRSGLLNCYAVGSGARELEPVEHAGAVVSVAQAASGEFVATASERMAQFWQLSMRTPRLRVASTGTPVGDARFGPDGSWFAIGGADAVRIFNTTDGQLRRVLPIRGQVRDMLISSDGHRLIASSPEGGVIVWDPETGAVQSQLPPLPTLVSHLALSPDRRWLAATVGERAIVLLRDVESGRAVQPPLTNAAPVVNTQFSPDGRRLAVTATSGITEVWDLPSGPTGPEAPDRPYAVRRQHADRHEGVVWMAQFSQNGRWLLTASNDRTARVWDVESGKVLREFRHQKPVYHARFAPGERRILTGGADDAARLWSLEDGRPVGEPMPHPGAVWYGEFSQDGKLVLTGDDTGHARVWDASTGLPLNGWVTLGSDLKRLHLSPDGQLVLGASVDSAKLWRPLIASGPAPAWLPDLAEAVAGLRQLDDRALEPVAPGRLAELHGRLISHPGTDFYSRWARWFLVDRMQPDPPGFQYRLR